ncbi:hypothetical protein A2154_04990 [Candidatus Gottesmanbacteria bacterium RBG_16_43_7]|uniref:Uncharacterized protein n=1 Tax=Candidatus Gottesmanbacteria bacterium RBG_16_43_7 TaxID=1798373 RepID=A0A1F5ZD13_9BACT|nr:MAG: hypothetical protein A2154_04990 [Candidatus Gottesmanbacteria bacterium RBG_16_43_7]
MADNINLFTQTVDIPEYVKILELQLKKLAVGILLLTVAAGALTFFGFSALSIQHVALVATEKRLMRQLDSLKGRESKFLVVKGRAKQVEEIVKVSKPIGELIMAGFDINPPPNLKSIEYSDQGQVVFNFSSGSIEESLVMAQKMIDRILAGRIEKARLRSYSVNDKGISVIFSFYPLW